ncbi:hypothetical protein L2E82_24282 [Cichorium intybus]|uniref:Uncharacterized protein n=1 Tax=Cichorium intybus TaxID=13427 RepID=A0ACB9E0I6_CICIN|nr:hypothetical protein L2E82_24282 [Cichorium intybus]
MNRKPGYGAKLRANLEPTKGVGRLRQQDGGHGSRNPLRRSPETSAGASGRVIFSVEQPAHPGNDSVGGKGSRQNGSVTSGKGLALRAGHGGPSPEPVGCRRTARAASAARVGHRVPSGDGLGTAPSGAFPGRRTANSELCSECQSEEIQPSAGKRRE